MATSETVGQTIFTTQKVIDHAYRRAKIPAELITAEKLASALDLLWLFLQEQSSEGAPVWRIDRQLVGLKQAGRTLTMPLGAVRVLNANLRTLQRLSGTYTTSSGGDPDLAFDEDVQTACTQTAPNGNIAVQFDTNVIITNVGLLPNASGTWDFVYEVSEDGVAWETVAVFTDQTVTNREWLWQDLEITVLPSYAYFRVRATDGTTLDVRELYVANTPQAIPMAPLNKDDYFNLPNKDFQGRPVQYWQDFDRVQPVLNLWPAPNEAANFQQVELQLQLAIQDVGTMRQELDIPQRWYNAVVWNLAVAVAEEDPEFKGDIKDLREQARVALAKAWAGITNDGPINLMPNIAPYTRC